MSYSSIAEVAHSGALRERIAACAAVEGIIDPHPTADEAVITDGMILSAVQAIRGGAL